MYYSIYDFSGVTYILLYHTTLTTTKYLVSTKVGQI
jgi:hypothetical protein